LPAIIPGSRLHSFLDAVRNATGQVLTRVFGANWAVEIDTGEGVPSDESSFVCFQISASGALEGNASVQLGASDARLLAQTFLAESIDPAAELNRNRKEALEELVRQVAGLATAEMTELFGETKLDVSIIEPSTGQELPVTLRASGPSSGKLILELRLSPELLASVSPKAGIPDQSAIAPGETSNKLLTNEANHDLLMGVKLNLTLRFGRRIMLLREILELNPGSVIELDREVQEPADLLLGDKIIARGQVVIVDGNYGLRITEVADARQRV
jgi:flagellar motor switch protein FliN/FliY